MTSSAPRARRIALLLEYEGTRYAGSQLQVNAPTIQGELEAAILKTTGETARATFAGRTDAGVHALGQVAAFDTSSALPVETVRDALNAWLPRDIAVRAAAPVEATFDPRRQALRRRYRYVVENRAVRPAPGRELCWHVARPLDAAAMAEAASLIAGEHDFAAFAGALDPSTSSGRSPSTSSGRSPSTGSGRSTVRRLESLTVARDGTRVTIEATANAFLPHQVRRMVGALVEVGAGRLTANAFGALLGGPPSSAGPAAPPQGLFLVSVDYARAIFAQS